jgi:uncharacterized protein (DUF488 family)
MIERVLTIGVYGFDAGSFLSRLKEAGADLLVDIRARRGVRGAEYAFANAARLQASLAKAGIAYAHAKELLPPKEIRTAQYAVDKAAGVGKRDRTMLSESFVREYESRCLAGFDARRFVEAHCAGARRPVLFCVEREPGACHRSLVAKRLAEGLGVMVEDLRP